MNFSSSTIEAPVLTVRDAQYEAGQDAPVERPRRVGLDLHIVDMVKGGEIQLVFTTVDETRTAIADSRYIRTAAIANRVTYYTTMAGCEAATEALKHEDDITVVSLQELHAELP